MYKIMMESVNIIKDFFAVHKKQIIDPLIMPKQLPQASILRFDHNYMELLCQFKKSHVKYRSRFDDNGELGNLTEKQKELAKYYTEKRKKNRHYRKLSEVSAKKNPLVRRRRRDTHYTPQYEPFA
jgi:hypothetical protein